MALDDASSPDHAKVEDFVEDSLRRELDNVKLWQLRIKTALEQVPKNTHY